MSEQHQPGYTSGDTKVVSAKNNIVSFFIPDQKAIKYYQSILGVTGVLSFTYPGTGGENPYAPPQPPEPQPET